LKIFVKQIERKLTKHSHINLYKDKKTNILYMKKKLKVVEKVEEGNLKGNTSTQISASKYWCFTWHIEGFNEQLDEIVETFNEFNIYYWIFSYELGKSGERPHIQGYIEGLKEFRPSELKLNKTIHWEKSKIKKKNLIREFNTKYICKEYGPTWVDMRKVFKDKIRFNDNWEEYVLKVLKKYYPCNPNSNIKILDEDKLYDWEKEIVSIVTDDPHERLIYWYWSTNGNVGKSTFCKYLVIKHNALILSGNAKDMKYAVMEYKKNNDLYPELIVLDIARDTNVNKLCYSGFEEVKNGLFFSGKYESGMVVGNTPHFIVFSNNEPIYSKMSQDRWKVTELF
jgi:transposase-like protein